MMKVLLLGDIANRWAVSVERVQELVQIDPPRGVYYITIKDALYLEVDITEYEQLHAELSQVYIRGRNLRAFTRRINSEIKRANAKCNKLCTLCHSLFYFILKDHFCENERKDE